ncbi:aryl-sulfate sulfotransferase [uncultured Sutterella sp.]|uniref:aryl-sulfate sulfotransferase n=1 Tax=uncultured Sutterella sp. TaxID=286133 RepID=UPI0025CC3011|nr:aryl-sulfate sulfotransferase [uncultured Sutterella sp.]
MSFRTRLTPVAVAVSLAAGFGLAFSGAALAAGGGSGPAVHYVAPGKLGEIVNNPYKIAPLTAVIKNGGYVLKDATVRIVPKKDGQEIKYKVSDTALRTYAGIPVWGLYPDYNNTVEVSYTYIDNGKETRVKNEQYRMYAPAVFTPVNGSMAQHHNMFETEVVKVDPAFNDRLYLINNFLSTAPKQARVVWNNPTGGALEWNYYPQNAVIDTKGEVRWYMFVDPIYDPETIYNSGIMMGFHQGKDGFLTFGYGQRYAKYDIMGREVFNRRLPTGYADFSHALDPAQNGHLFLRVSSSDYRRPDGKRVHTVRDVIAEVDANGNVVDEFRLFDILDPYRDVVIKTLDQGAVCLNLDATQSGKTLSAEELAAMDKNDKFGDIAGVGPGRNWAHVNSVDYDPTDDSIVISSRHQSAVIKIGRDKKVKWILATPTGWKGDLAKKVLTPVDKDGKPIKCSENRCEGDFDWTWTQHTGWRIDSKSNADVFYLSAFDNGDGRALEQPPLPDMKYSRAVIYKIDQKKMTVQQIWEYGKERGHDWFSPVTSLVEYQTDKDSVMVYSATASLDLRQFNTVAPHPVIDEFKWGEKEPAVEIRIKSSLGYQAMPINVQKAFDMK